MPTRLHNGGLWSQWLAGVLAMVHSEPWTAYSPGSGGCRSRSQSQSGRVIPPKHHQESQADARRATVFTSLLWMQEEARLLPRRRGNGLYSTHEWEVEVTLDGFGPNHPLSRKFAEYADTVSDATLRWEPGRHAPTGAPIRAVVEAPSAEAAIRRVMKLVRLVGLRIDRGGKVRWSGMTGRASRYVGSADPSTTNGIS